MFSHDQLKDVWLEMAYTRFMPELLKLVQGQLSLEVKYAACCVFRALAHYEEFVVHVTDVILPAVILMRNTSAKFKVHVYRCLIFNFVYIISFLTFR